MSDINLFIFLGGSITRKLTASLRPRNAPLLLAIMISVIFTRVTSGYLASIIADMLVGWEKVSMIAIAQLSQGS